MFYSDGCCVVFIHNVSFTEPCVTTWKRGWLPSKSRWPLFVTFAFVSVFVCLAASCTPLCCCVLDVGCTMLLFKSRRKTAYGLFRLLAWVDSASGRCGEENKLILTVVLVVLLFFTDALSSTPVCWHGRRRLNPINTRSGKRIHRIDAGCGCMMKSSPVMQSWTSLHEDQPLTDSMSSQASCLNALNSGNTHFGLCLSV